MAEQNNNFKEKFAAFWSVKRNKIITSAVGGVLVVGIYIMMNIMRALLLTHIIVLQILKMVPALNVEKHIGLNVNQLNGRY